MPQRRRRQYATPQLPQPCCAAQCAQACCQSCGVPINIQCELMADNGASVLLNEPTKLKIIITEGTGSKLNYIFDMANLYKILNLT